MIIYVSCLIIANKMYYFNQSVMLLTNNSHYFVRGGEKYKGSIYFASKPLFLRQPCDQPTEFITTSITDSKEPNAVFIPQIPSQGPCTIWIKIVYYIQLRFSSMISINCKFILIWSMLFLCDKAVINTIPFRFPWSIPCSQQVPSCTHHSRTH